MNLAKKLVSFTIIPMIFSCAIFTSSCNKEIIFNCHFKNHAIEKGWEDPVIDMDLKEFKKHFDYGDIIELKFATKDNRNFTIDLPYVTEFTEAGYYSPCIADYMDSTDKVNAVDVSIALWPSSNNVNMEEQVYGQPVTVKMKSKAGFKDAMNLAHCTTKLTFEETGYSADTFANFRDISKIGNLRKFIYSDKLFRGSAPFTQKDSDIRHQYVNDLMKYNNVEYDICLSAKSGTGDDRFETMVNNSTNADYIKGLTKNEKYAAIKFGTDYFTSSALEKVKSVLETLADDNVNSYYIHCNEGKDRTGFFIMLLEAFATPDKEGNCVSVDDIIADFMISYKNYFNITLADNIKRYQEIVKLTIYRHIYSIMLDNPETDVGKVPWFDENFDVRTEVNKKLENKTLWSYANNYIRNTVKLGNDAIEKIEKKFYINKNLKEIL